MAARKRAGFTQEKFAEAVGVDRSTVGRWESGTRSPQFYQRPELADLLKISVARLVELLDETSTPTEQTTSHTTDDLSATCLVAFLSDRNCRSVPGDGTLVPADTSVTGCPAVMP
ncbi:helix-turn-helix domain-containing protein [Actinokineospora globicatena]|uniref:helix-turn-helix domain-containing protein n=1 Tax=Actinokineospora globicatena TaxID=103729 RepID=UPI0020A25132|nr:helix-turn-helix transcriptional regulator [Actinokineospora globicatena]GLW79158.1 hypothetical protein Aglo01_36400 [Actinokineospora globicatena]GLW86432.1 hypothetical protein Aglo02_40710 [Actinokineospora globicatena]